MSKIYEQILLDQPPTYHISEACVTKKLNDSDTPNCLEVLTSDNLVKYLNSVYE